MVQKVAKTNAVLLFHLTQYIVKLYCILEICRTEYNFLFTAPLNSIEQRALKLYVIYTKIQNHAKRFDKIMNI